MTRRSFLATLTAMFIVQPQRQPFASGKLQYGKWYRATEAQRRTLAGYTPDRIILSGAEMEQWMKRTFEEAKAWRKDMSIIDRLKAAEGARRAPLTITIET